MTAEENVPYQGNETHTARKEVAPWNLTALKWRQPSLFLGLL